MRAIRLLPLPTLVLLAAPLAAQSVPPNVSTFSIVACDPEARMLGVAVQSRVVGAGSIVPAAEAGVGAVATQAAANVAYKRQALEMLRAGMTPEQVRDSLVRSDEGIARRQFAVMDADCNVAAFTGEGAQPWAGHRTGAHYSVQGNILAGPEVVEAMARGFEAAEAEGRPFGERLLAALRAGQDAGGDRRGRQAAGMLIVRPEGGYGGADDRYADLRVEDHVEPILELERVYGIWMSLFHPEDHFLPAGTAPISAPAGPHVCLLRERLAELGYGEAPPEDREWCAFDEEAISALKAFQRARGLPERAALDERTAEALREAAGPR